MYKQIRSRALSSSLLPQCSAGIGKRCYCLLVARRVDDPPLQFYLIYWSSPENEDGRKKQCGQEKHKHAEKNGWLMCLTYL